MDGRLYSGFGQDANFSLASERLVSLNQAFVRLLMQRSQVSIVRVSF